MGTALILAAFIVAPLVVFVLRRVCWLIGGWWERRQDRRRPVVSTVASIERVAADLRRLRARLEARENEPGLTGKGMRMGALRTAYVEVLGVACQQLDIRPPQRMGRPQAPLAEIYRVEAELRQRGLDVRPPDFGEFRAA